MLQAIALTLIIWYIVQNAIWITMTLRDKK